MKKAILVISFGTSYIDSLKKSIENVEITIKNEFTDYDVYRAFTAHRIINKLNSNYGMKILTPEEALDKLYEDGYTDIIMQPLHIIPGEEFDYINNIKEKYEKNFNSLKLGRPVFYYQGIEGVPDDYSLFIESVKELFENQEAVVLIGHGTPNPSNAVYGCLQAVLEDDGYSNVFVGTIEGYPNFNTVVKRIKNKKIKEVLLVPLLLVAGEHAINDIASENEYSWKSMFEKEGINVKLHMKGLGELSSFNRLYINRINDLIENNYIGIGQTKKGKRHCKH